MRVSDAIGAAWRANRASPGRSLLTCVAIAAGVAAVVCTLAIGDGAEQDIADQLRALGSNLLVVAPGSPTVNGVRMEAGARRDLTARDAEAIARDLPEVQSAAPVVLRRTQVVGGGRNWSTMVVGATAPYLDMRGWTVAAGRPFDAADDAAGARVATVGADVAEGLFGTQEAVGRTLRIGVARLTIIAVMQRKGVGAAGRSQDDVVFTPLSTARAHVFGAAEASTRDGLDFISVKVADADELSVVSSDIRDVLRRRHRLRQGASDDFTVQDPADVLKARAAAVRTLSWLLTTAAAVSLAVGGISVMNTMLASIGERTREFGVRRAVGARRRDIVLQLLAETIALALAGGLMGCLVGVVASATIGGLANWRVATSPFDVLIAWCASGAVGIAFGLYPAYRAARLDPIDALRFE